MDTISSHILVNLDVDTNKEREMKRNSNDILNNNGTGYVLPHDNLESKIKLALMDLKKTKSIVGSTVRYELDVGDAKVVLSVGLLFEPDNEQPGYELSILHYRYIEELDEIGFYKGHGTHTQIGEVTKKPSKEALANAQSMINDSLAREFIKKLQL